LGLARASQTDASLLTLEMGPAAHQAGRQVGQLRQFHLQLPFEASSSLRKNVKNQTVTVQYSTTSELFEVAFLTGTQRLINQHDLGAELNRTDANFLSLTATDEILRIGPRAGCEHDPHGDCAGRGGQRFEFSRVVRIDRMTDTDTDQ
jgi:hypothetical protein